MMNDEWKAGAYLFNSSFCIHHSSLPFNFHVVERHFVCFAGVKSDEAFGEAYSVSDASDKLPVDVEGELWAGGAHLNLIRAGAAADGARRCPAYFCLRIAVGEANDLVLGRRARVEQKAVAFELVALADPAVND